MVCAMTIAAGYTHAIYVTNSFCVTFVISGIKSIPEVH